jgi:Bacteriophage HK97-gp10, putative tail-component
MSSTEVTIVGVDHLLAKLGAMEAKGVRRVMLKAIAEGAKVLRRSIKSAAVFEAPKTGNMRAGIRYKASRKATRQLAYMVGPFGSGTYHRHLVIEGHEVVGHKPNLTRTGKRTTPNPFVERGSDAGKDEAFAAIEAAARVRFDELTIG